MVSLKEDEEYWDFVKNHKAELLTECCRAKINWKTRKCSKCGKKNPYMKITWDKKFLTEYAKNSRASRSQKNK